MKRYLVFRGWSEELAADLRLIDSQGREWCRGRLVIPEVRGDPRIQSSIILPGETMSTEDEMTIDERRKYLRKRQQRYAKADRTERGKLLDEMEQVTNLHRKYLVALMGGDLKRNPRRRQRAHTCGPEVDDALRVIYESFDYICAERLTANLVWMIKHLIRPG